MNIVVAGQHGEQPGGDAAGRGRDLTPAGLLGLGPAGVQDIQGEVSQEAVISLTNSVNHHSSFSRIAIINNYNANYVILFRSDGWVGGWWYVGCW